MTDSRGQLVGVATDAAASTAGPEPVRVLPQSGMELALAGELRR
jgi:hypothetical protein